MSLRPLRPPSRKSAKPVVPVRSTEMRVGVPEALDDQAARERVPRASCADLHDDVVLPADGPLAEPRAVVEPAGDATHAVANGRPRLNVVRDRIVSHNLYGGGAFPQACAAVAQPGRAGVS